MKSSYFYDFAMFFANCNFATTEPILKVRSALKSHGPESSEFAIYDAGVPHHYIIGILGNDRENFAKLHGA